MSPDTISLWLRNLNNPRHKTRDRGNFLILGIALSLGAALGFGTAAVLARTGMQHIGSTSATLVSVASSALITVAIAFIYHTPEILALPAGVFLWFLLAGAINFPGGRLMNFTAIRLIGASRATVVISTSPLFAASLAVILTGESLSLLVGLGTLAIMAGVMLVVTQR